MNSGFNILKYDIISSTNDKAKEILQKNNIPDFTVISAKQQTKGRGQRENLWYSEYGKNLLFSIITYPNKLKAENQFYISKAVSVGIVNYLNKIKTGFKIKWPNDIYFENKKVCGILIENTISGSYVKNTVTGTGLNVNQDKFPDFLPRATSLHLITGNFFDTEYELNKLLISVKAAVNLQNANLFSEIDDLYHKNLYKVNEKSKFKDKNGVFEGVIKGTLPQGRLIIETENEKRFYDFKEVEFLI